jgi:hypothetical protein
MMTGPGWSQPRLIEGLQTMMIQLTLAQLERPLFGAVGIVQGRVAPQTQRRVTVSNFTRSVPPYPHQRFASRSFGGTLRKSRRSDGLC